MITIATILLLVISVGCMATAFVLRHLQAPDVKGYGKLFMAIALFAFAFAVCVASGWPDS